MGTIVLYIVVVFVALFVLGGVSLVFQCYQKVHQGTALIRNGWGGAQVFFTGTLVYPVVHWIEPMDVSVKRIEINREGKEGLICKDNLRADVKVVFFVRVNNTTQDVLKVAQSIGCRRASDPQAMVELFDAKFSEALKTVGKKFDFVELYTARERFKEEILRVIGTDLNGYVLDDAAIDFLEQTPVEVLNPNNILDSEGIKKINELTANQAILANEILRNKEMTIVQQDVKARETVLELQRQQAQAEEKQKREITIVKAREEAEGLKVKQEERLKSERARIITDEELAIAEENKNRQIIVAKKNKERTEAVEIERVEKDRLLEVTERERIVSLTTIEKDKAIEAEQKIIQDVIRQRVSVQRAVVEEEEKIKDTREFAGAERKRKSAVILAEMEAEQSLVKQIKAAEAAKKASVFESDQKVIEAEAVKNVAEKESAAKKILAEALSAEAAAKGLAEAKVLEAKAVATEKQGAAEARVLEAKSAAFEKQGTAEAKVLEIKSGALEKQGTVEAHILEIKALAEAKALQAKAEAHQKEGAVDASIIELKAFAEAKGIQARADAHLKEGTNDASIIEAKLLAEANGIKAKAEGHQKHWAAEANSLQLKLEAEALGIEKKANAMKLLDEIGRRHEEFKLRLNKDKEVELALINTQGHIASQQAQILGEAFKSAKIDIVGGEPTFFNKIIGAVSAGKVFDRFVESSSVLTEAKEAFFCQDSSSLKEKFKEIISKFGLTTEDLKNITVSALLLKMALASKNDLLGISIQKLIEAVKAAGVGETIASTFLLDTQKEE